jgi:hypothetical protein
MAGQNSEQFIEVGPARNQELNGEVLTFFMHELYAIIIEFLVPRVGRSYTGIENC